MTRDSPPAGTRSTELLAWMCAVGPVTAASAAARLGGSEPSARARLEAAVRRGLAQRVKPLAGRPSLYLPTAAALATAGLRGIAAPTVTAASAGHALACAAVAGELVRRYPGAAIAGEPLLRLGERCGAGVSVRVGLDRLAQPRLHRPDLAVWPPCVTARDIAAPEREALVCWPVRGQRVSPGPASPARPLPLAVEVELTVKAPARLRAICLAWARSRTVSGVLYFVSAVVRAPLLRALAAVDAAERVVLIELSDPHLLTPPGSSEASQAARSFRVGG